MLKKRIARACERCRQTRRRCEPPHPCPACIAAGVECEVRLKARPKRKRTQQRSTSDQVTTLRNQNNVTEILPLASSLPTQQHITNGSDTFAQVHELLRCVLRDERGYDLNCRLSEPELPEVSAVVYRQGASPSQLSSLSEELIGELLSAFERFNGGDLVDPTELQAIGHRVLAFTPEPLHIDVLTDKLATHGVTLDTACLFFSALAIGAFLSDHCTLAGTFFNFSIASADRFVGSPSYDLCLAYFLQHGYVLRAGTLTRARAMIAQSVQACHDLKLHHGSHGTRGLHLYLLVYMADQYSSLTYETSPLIQTAMLSDGAFESLANARPCLRPLIDLVTLNGRVIEYCSRTTKSSTDPMAVKEVAKLEASIGGIQMQQQTKHSHHRLRKSFTAICEPIARIHMLCCRIQLRAPGLSCAETWISSISITSHAAAGVLATYFKLYLPALRSLASRESSSTSGVEKQILPPTWRQVKRIMLCVFIVILAYLRGEIPYEDASNRLATARLSLEYPRSRWGNKLHKALKVIEDVSQMTGLGLHEYMRTLLPSQKPNFPLPLDAGDVQSTATRDTAFEGQGFSRDIALPTNEVPTTGSPFGFAQWNTPDVLSASSGPLFERFEDAIHGPSLWELCEDLLEGPAPVLGFL